IFSAVFATYQNKFQSDAAAPKSRRAKSTARCGQFMARLTRVALEETTSSNDASLPNPVISAAWVHGAGDIERARSSSSAHNRPKGGSDRKARADSRSNRGSAGENEPRERIGAPKFSGHTYLPRALYRFFGYS